MNKYNNSLYLLKTDDIVKDFKVSIATAKKWCKNIDDGYLNDAFPLFNLFGVHKPFREYLIIYDKKYKHARLMYLKKERDKNKGAK